MSDFDLLSDLAKENTLQEISGKASLESTQSAILSALGAVLTELGQKMEAGQQVALTAETLAALESISTSVSNFPADYPNSAAASILQDIRDGLDALRLMLRAVAKPIHFDPTTGRAKATSILESGTLTTLSTLTAALELTNINSYPGKILMTGANATAWAQTVRRLLD